MIWQIHVFSWSNSSKILISIILYIKEYKNKTNIWKRVKEIKKINKRLSSVFYAIIKIECAGYVWLLGISNIAIPS